MKTISSKSAVTSSTASVAAASAVPPLPVEIANVPSVAPEAVEAFVAAIDAFALLLGAGFSVPQPDEMKRLAKPRKEAPVIVPMVADLSGRYGVVSAAYPNSVTLVKQQTVNTLSPVAERIGAVQKLVSAVISVAAGGAWEGSMVTYGLLKSEARGNAVLRNALAPVREKLRPTYETEDGKPTKVRSRSRAVKAKTAAAKAAQTPATTEAPGTGTAPAATPAAPAAATADVAKP